MNQIINAGHIWEAMMTATEVHDRIVGTQPVVVRSVTLNKGDVSATTVRFQERHYKTPDNV
ncbi:hypothetical protein OS189_17880 [Sulfitobacter sp. F26169L]|uniref:hypothetical protein n=1 Tax=Sulfitobacter sp. F26169L TaxID=2996015 RepID=UPI002260C74A|nr:hypothetical protein [Sulfitobacter sp. F26169L]MCX7568215.1 hypothetical protein [Sulfitobacter sp. F26169L]